MANPFDYIGPLADIPSASDSFTKGIMTAEALDTIRKKNAAEKIALDEQMRIRNEIATNMTNPTIQGVTQLLARNPSLIAQYKPILDTMTEQQKTSAIQQASNVLVPLLKKDRKTAIQQLELSEAAARNSGNELAARTAALQKKMIESTETGDAGDKFVMGTAMMSLATLMGPENFSKNYAALQEQQRESELEPFKLKEQEAKASAAATKAKFAESEAALDLQKKGWDITKIQNDIDVSKENAKIAMINASIARESNALKRDELKLKLDDQLLKRDERVREKVSEAESSLSTIDQSNEIISNLLSDQNTLRSITGASSFKGSIPGTKGRAMAGKIEQLQNTIASANLDKLKGAMSDKDIIFLKNIATSLDRSQDEESFIKELKRIQRTLSDSRSRVMRKYGLPEVEQQETQPAPPLQPRNITVDW